MILEKVILIYGAGDKKELLNAALSDYAVLFVPEDKNGALLSDVISMRAAVLPKPIPEPFAVFHGFSGAELDAAIEAVKLSGAEISLKAVTTPVNLGWDGERLYKNLRAEREALKKYKSRKKR